MKKLLFLSLLALGVTPAIFADFGDVFGPTVAGATIGGIAGGGRGAGIGAAVGFGVGAMSSSARDRDGYYRDGYYDDGYYSDYDYGYSRPVRYRQRIHAPYNRTYRRTYRVR